MVSNISQHKLTPPYFDALVEFKIRLEKLSSDGIYSRHNGFGVSVRLHSNKQISCDQVLLEGQDLVSTLFFINSDVQDMENSKNTSGLILFCSKLPFSHDLFRQKNINYVLFISIYDGQSLVFREKILLHFDCIHGINAVRPLMCNNIRIISFQISVFARLVCIPLTTNVDLLAFGEKYNISCPTDSNDIHDQLWHAYIFLLLSSKPLKPNPSFSFTNDEFPFINIDFNQIIKNIYFICEILNTIFLSMESFNTNVENHYSQNDNSPIQRNKYTDPIDMLEMQKELEVVIYFLFYRYP
ncbi:hypothetical protein A3Q56_03361 [Intoshia linei]|uniref:Uncharacterized protein n=1 Tax=Intoshia linei TaxID=1819745 RepID=A0A177B5H5_9BILA|nr:hypothetical protein A3Q56_03361 [Intoshia linei]